MRKRETDAHRVQTALMGWAEGIETLEAGYAGESMDSYRMALRCRDILEVARTTAVFKQRTILAARLPELDRRFEAATVPAARCVHETLECDSAAEWWYYRVPASHPEWPEEVTA